MPTINNSYFTRGHTGYKVLNRFAADLAAALAGGGNVTLTISQITDATATGIALVQAASASAGRTVLGLVIGTNVQAYNANLAALAGLTLAADKLAYATGVGALALADLTAAGRALLDDADAAAQLVTLGAQAAQLPTSDVAGLPSAGTTNARRLRWCTNGNAGAACVVVSDGTNWKVLALGSTASAT